MTTPVMTYKLSAYEGPIDLLYRLIQAHKLDIYDIPIASLTDQYLDFLERADSKDMDSMSEFVLMAATLIEIKSKLLLPKQIDEEGEADPRQELVDRLLEYKKVKLAAALFMQYEETGDDIFYKAPERDFIKNLKPKESLDDILQDITANRLYAIFQDVLGKKELKVDKVRSSFKAVAKDLYTVEEKTAHIQKLLSIRGFLSFRALIQVCASKSEAVVTFLALLELIKTRQIKVAQEHLFDDIEIRKCA